MKNTARPSNPASDSAVTVSPQPQRSNATRWTIWLSLGGIALVGGTASYLRSLGVIQAVDGRTNFVSLRLWPWTYCRRCSGGGQNAGSNRKRWGSCRACGGSGRKERLGARMIRR